MENGGNLLFNRNEKQLNFNTIKGILHECNDGDDWCSITLNVGHENPRFINLAIKKPHFDVIKDNHKIGNKVIVMFYLTSRYKNGRWYTTANILQVDNLT
jgi:hypothetical protein